MKFTDRKGRQWTLTRIQALYLTEASKRPLAYGWGGYRSTLVVRLLEERGLITVRHSVEPDRRWTITDLTTRGGGVLADWQRATEQTAHA